MTRSSPKRAVRNFLTADLLTCPVEKLGFDDTDTTLKAAGELQGLGINARIRACVLITHALDRAAHSPHEYKHARDLLLSTRIISRNEYDLEKKSPKLSNIRKVAKHAAFLLAPELKALVPTGLRTQVEFVGLYEAIRKLHPGTSIADFAERLSRTDGAVTIEFLTKSREELQESAKPKSSISAEVASEQVVMPSEEPINCSSEIQEFDLLLVNAVGPHCEGLREIGAEPPPCVRYMERMADDAIAVVIGPVKHIPLVFRRLLREADFQEFPTVYLATAPSDPDISNATAIAVTWRGKGSPAVITDWPKATIPTSLVDQIALHAVSRLSLFADARTPGWTCLVGEENWSETPADA